MSYVAVDQFGAHIFKSKPVRSTYANYDAWRTEDGDIGVDIPITTINILFRYGLLHNCKIPLDKRNMNWDDNPICVVSDDTITP